MTGAARTGRVVRPESAPASPHARHRSPQNGRPAGTAARRGGEVAGEPAVSDRVLTVPNALSLLRLLLVPVFAGDPAQRSTTARRCSAPRSAGSPTTSTARWPGGGVRCPGWANCSTRSRTASHLAILLGLGYREMMPWWLVIAIVGRDVLLGPTVIPALPGTATARCR